MILTIVLAYLFEIICKAVYCYIYINTVNVYCMKYIIQISEKEYIIIEIKLFYLFVSFVKLLYLHLSYMNLL